MQARYLTAAVGLVLSLGTGVCLAQSPSTKVEVDPKPHSKDIFTNDPSPRPQLGLDEIIKQKHLAREAFLRGFFLGGYLKETVQDVFHIRYSTVLKKHPDWFELLALHEDRYSPKKENGPAIANTNFEFDGISRRDYGYCWGFATLIKNFSVLAFFDPSAKPADPTGRILDPVADHDEWLQFYQDRIEQVAIYDKATVIPGFANFREFSLVPELELYLKLKAMHLWRRMAVTPRGLGTMLRSHHHLSTREQEKLLTTLEAKFKRHEIVKINISSEVAYKQPFDYSKHLHVILAYGVERTADGGAKIKVWDVNFYAETMEKEPKMIDLTADGQIFYQPWQETGTKDAPLSNRLSRIEISPENNQETVDHLYSLKKFCSNPATAGYCK